MHHSLDREESAPVLGIGWANTRARKAAEVDATKVMVAAVFLRTQPNRTRVDKLVANRMTSLHTLQIALLIECDETVTGSCLFNPELLCEFCRGNRTWLEENP